MKTTNASIENPSVQATSLCHSSPEIVTKVLSIQDKWDAYQSTHLCAEKGAIAKNKEGSLHSSLVFLCSLSKGQVLTAPHHSLLPSWSIQPSPAGVKLLHPPNPVPPPWSQWVKSGLGTSARKQALALFLFMTTFTPVYSSMPGALGTLPKCRWILSVTNYLSCYNTYIGNKPLKIRVLLLSAGCKCTEHAILCWVCHTLPCAPLHELPPQSVL